MHWYWNNFFFVKKKYNNRITIFLSKLKFYYSKLKVIDLSKSWGINLLLNSIQNKIQK